MKSREQILAYIEDYFDCADDILLLDGFDEAFLGIAEKFGAKFVAVYDYDQVIKKLMVDMEEEDAIEYFEFNVIGSWVGEATPIFLRYMPSADVAQG